MLSFLHKRLLWAVLSLLSFSNKTIAQPYYFRHYQVENGLSNNAVICCLQDKKGFIWFGTKDGLNRFDGYSFKTFRNNPLDTGTIGNNFIHCLYEDQNGVLWAGTENGLYSYNEKTESFSLLRSTENVPVTDIKMDGRGNLWYIQLFNCYKYDIANNKFQSFLIPDYFETSSLAVSPAGDLWASSTSGFLYRYDFKSNSFKGYDVFSHNRTTSRWIERIAFTGNGNILVGTAIGAKIFDTRKFQYKDILSYNPDKTAIFVRNFLENTPDEIWIASETGIYIYNNRTGNISNLQKAYNDPFSISDNAVYTFCKDKEDGIWAGTYFGGVNYYPKQHTAFKKFFPKTGENSLSGNVVREIHADNYGNLWIGTEDAGLNKYNPSTGLFTIYKPTGNKNSISYTNIHGIMPDGDKIWIGTFEHGLDIMDIQTGNIIKHYSSGPAANQLKSDFIFCITKTNKDEIVLGTTRGAYRYNKASDDFSSLQGMPLYIWYSYLLRDSKGTLWGATYGNGINYYNPATKDSGSYRYAPGDNKSIASDRVNSIYEDSSNNLWFATEGGLSKYDYGKKQFKTYTTGNGLPSNFILSILEDSNKNLWLSTSRGIVCFTPSTEQIKIYATANGTLNDQFNFNSAFKDSTGRMYFGSVKGMISFSPEAFTKNIFIPSVYITGFQVFNKELLIGQKESPLQKSISYTDKLTLKHDQATFSIDFASLGYTAPEMSEYAYKMEGLDKNWTYLKRNRKAYFTNLAPGSYTFKVKASNSSGIWNDSETSLVIQILPPWWASIWAYSIYTLIGLLAIYYSIRSYHKRVEEKNKRKYELFQLAKEKEIFEAKVEFFTNVAHEIKTPLTLIKGPLEKVIKKADGIPDITNNLKIMDRNTNRLIELTNQLLDFRQTELQGFSLSFVQVNISELLEETYLSFKSLAEQKKLSFKLKLSSNVLYAYIDLDAFKKIIYNLFGNAVKYADKKVVIHLLPCHEQDKSFTIEFKNDGYIIPEEMKEKIFEPFFRLKETEKQKGTGIGLALSRSLAELHSGFIHLKPAEKDMNVFCLTLPVHQQNEFNIAFNRDNINHISKPTF